MNISNGQSAAQWPQSVYKATVLLDFSSTGMIELINYGQFYDLNVSANEANSIRSRCSTPVHLTVKSKSLPTKTESKSSEMHGMKSYVDSIKRRAEACMHLRFKMRFHSSWILQKDGRNHPKKKAQNPTAHFPNVLVRDGKAGVSYSECPLCPYAHAPGEICPEFECPICKQKNSGCSGKKCTFTCSTCSKTGECTPTTCNNQCKHCGGTHKSHLCPKAPKPKTPKSVCDGCGKEKCECKQGTTKPPSRAQRSSSECMRTTNNRTLMT